MRFFRVKIKCIIHLAIGHLTPVEKMAELKKVA
jgi:hypothetical protein